MKAPNFSVFSHSLAPLHTFVVEPITLIPQLHELPSRTSSLNRLAAGQARVGALD